MVAKEYSETSVHWPVDEIDVNASLTRPEGSGPFPAVIMVAGSGPTDRNWNTPLLPGTNGSAALLARALTDEGFVTLRYDKRASGPRGKEYALRMQGKISMQSHLDELAGGVRLLVEHKDADSKDIFALTNSEGCIHALNYQIQSPNPPFAGLILTAPPARPVGVVAHAQLEAQLKALPDGSNLLAAYDAAMKDFVAGKEVKSDDSLPEWLRNLIIGITNPINQPFARQLWLTDVASLITDVTAPILILIGKKDLQVDWKADGEVFESLAKSRPNISIAFPENANHVLKYEPLDRSQLAAEQVGAGYNAEDRVLDKESLKIITAWLAAHR